MNIITLGTFDILHYGHIRLFKKCKELSVGGIFAIGLNTDEFVQKFKKRKPVMSWEERRLSIEELGMADLIFPNDQPNGTARGVILDSKADIIVIGSDWARKDYVGQLGLDWDWLDQHNIGICYLNYTGGISTTEIKRRILGQ